MGFAWKELFYEKKKYILIELVIILLMFMVLFLSGLVEGLDRSIISGVADMDAEYFLLSDSAGKVLTNSKIDTKTYEQLQTQTTAEYTPFNVQRLFLSQKGSEEKLDVTYFAIESGSFLEPKVYKGAQFSESEIQHPIILDDDFALHDIEVGDTVLDASSALEFTVVGFAKDKMYGHISIGYITLNSFIEMGRLQNSAYETTYHAVAIKGTDINRINLEKTELLKKSEVVANIPSYEIIHLTITAIEWVLVAITAAIIGVFYYIITIQKRKQFGVMKAIGIGMGRLTGMVAGQVGIVSAVGVILANILTVTMSAVLPATMPFFLNIANFCIVSVAFVFICIASSLVSVLTISRVDPMKAIGGEA